MEQTVSCSHLETEGRGATLKKVDLLKILEKLKKDEFEKFKWFLEDRGIATADLEDADRMKTVNLMVKSFTLHGAVKVTKEVLKEIPRMDLLQNLSASSSESEVSVDVEGAGGAPENRGAASSQTEGAVRLKERLADAVKNRSSLLEHQSGRLHVYKVPLEEERLGVAGCRRFSFGKESFKRNRTIMLLGATGAGKSTLINGMINYILGVEWEDSYRFKLVDEDPSKSQAHSQTSEVTVYKINHQQGFRIDHSLTIIDTPGFGDTRGIERDKMITEQLRNLFTDQRGVSEVDAVCLVAQAALPRLTPTHDSALSIFGRDVAENIRVLVTFADGQLPPVLKAIKESGVPCTKSEDGLPLHFKFNNSALFADNKSSAAGSRSKYGGFDQMFWDMGANSMETFFVALNVIETKSLILTKEVLRERQQLENSVENLQVRVKIGLAKLEEIREVSEKLKAHEAEISRNENFEIEITVRNSRNQEVKERVTVKELQERFNQAKDAKKPVEAMIARLTAEYDRVQAEVMKLMESSAQCLNRLKEIALKPDPLSTPEYIDLLIEGEKSEGRPGWKQRVQHLMTIRDKQSSWLN
ncbi:uncharacterized protein LOC115576554 [Sparus aurata]|uniref:uncharacterized protein LOC115576554 n=1 Tax=Sparus aurata TaxID=8175 RepID=UPI0011C162BC|nr:uncharacterized protein LOC115576554 [Sparus aurata]